MSRSVAVFLLSLFAFGAAAFPSVAAAKHLHAHGAPSNKTASSKSNFHKSTSESGRAGSLKSSANKPTRFKAKDHAHAKAESRLEARSRNRSGNSRTVDRRIRRSRLLQREYAAPATLQRVHLAMPAPLRGSHESLVHQNEMAEADGLERIQDDEDLQDRINRKSLVPIPAANSLQVNANLPENRRYCRPWTAQFLTDLAKAYNARFAGNALEVTSAVRTVEYQRKLRTVNGNAAAADGDIASPHLTGGTIDLAKAGLTSAQIGWLRAWLLPLEQAGKIDVEEEFRQSCFHISVYKSYAAGNSASPGKPQGPTTAPLSTSSAGIPAEGR